MTRIDARIIATVAFVAFAVSFLMRANFTANAAFIEQYAAAVGSSIRHGHIPWQMITILLDGVPAHRIPLASGLSNFARITSGGFAASLATTVWDRREALHQSRMADNITIFTPAFNQAANSLHYLGFSHLAAKGAIARTMVGQAYLMAADDIFWASGWVCLALIGMVWLCRPAVSGGGPVAAD